MKSWFGVFSILTLGAAVAALVYGRAPQEPPPVARNVILISIDTLRADHLSCYGYHQPTSPQIDAFARRGARFEQAISPSGWTVPAHMTMFTGLDPLEHGAGGYPVPDAVSREVDTVAEILRRNGVRTAAFVGGGYLFPRAGFNRGFQKYSSKGRHFTHNIDNAREWVRKNREDPFFLFFHGFDVHRPYTPSPRNAHRFAAEYAGTFNVSQLAADKPRPSDQDLQFAISQYDAEIRDVDDLLGELLSEWEAMGLLDTTLVIITSDHGDEFYEHGQVYHAHSLYDELLRVPLIMVGPGVVSEVYSRQVGLIDIAPTIVSAMGFGSESAGMRGIDLMPVVRGASRIPERLIFSHLRFSAYPYSISALRSDEWKLIAWELEGMRKRNVPWKRKEYTYKFRLDRTEDFDELFDLRQDPGEQRDVAADNADVRNRFSSVLQGRLRTRVEGPAPKRKQQPKLSPKEIEDLKALGYL